MNISKPLLELTAKDLMARDVVTIGQCATLREAAHTLRQAGVGGAAVVDEAGRCVGVMTATDFVRWAEGPPAEQERISGRKCPYRAKGSPESGWDGWICMLNEVNCPFQAIQPTSAGRHVSVCLRPTTGFEDWEQILDALPADTVRRYMTSDVVTVKPSARLPELARIMIDGGIHRLFITDEQGKPIGVVSATMLLAALAAQDAASSMIAPPTESAKVCIA